MGVISLFQTFGFQGDAGRKDADDAMHTLFDVLFTMVRMMVSLRDKQPQLLSAVNVWLCVQLSTLKHYSIPIDAHLLGSFYSIFE